MIPILINNRDLLDSPRELIKFFRQIPHAYVVLCDNASTYQPLRKWYKSIQLDDKYYDRGLVRWVLNPGCSPDYDQPHELFLFPDNRGPRAADNVRTFLNFKFDYYFLCDPDLDFMDVSLDFLEHLTHGFHKNTQGVGVSFRLDDLPPGKMRDYVLTVEKPYIPGSGFYKAGCDTAGVMRRSVPVWDGGYEGIRSANVIVRHRPWYFTPENPPPPDFQWYFDHADPSGTVYTSRLLDKTRESL